ncbi:hypothetical protein [Geobacter sp. SVR]|uniref:hypothetical protein n=1 Tax=Geobacter sp. SVR TaxID=2495594 RepID=UPI00143F03A9|nr:hypothetical protein [Geobacter sp. SVR]BCS53316.1 hypothetical protein GSVR_16240 [Geobacter sp. SVR]GCF85558.1 hypothetical protein GSbR_21580 [Geobacter sp. SVR]
MNVRLLRPMKAPTEAITDEQLESLSYPVYGSPKLDGFRAVIQGGTVLTSSLKPLPNEFVQTTLGIPELEGLDGELIVGSPYSTGPEDDVFNRTSGPLRRSHGEPDFTFYVFDTFYKPEWPYRDRNPQAHVLKQNGVLKALPQVLLHTPSDVLTYESTMLEQGYEGIILRSPNAPYKFGRCTAKEAYIFKRKPFADCEAEIIGFEEQEENLNEKVTSELGTSKRSSHKENKRPKGTLGKLILRCDKWEKSFACGTWKGLTAEARQKLWDTRESLIGKIVTFKYQPYGSIEAPRLPIIKGFRDKWDMTDY